MPVSLAATAMTIYQAMVGRVTRHTRNGTLLWLITIPDPAVVTSNPKYLENRDEKKLCPRERHEKATRRKHRPRRKITDVEQASKGMIWRVSTLKRMPLLTTVSQAAVE